VCAYAFVSPSRTPTQEGGINAKNKNKNHRVETNRDKESQNVNMYVIDRALRLVIVKDLQKFAVNRRL
jgi:hypothetical protein